MSSRKNKGARVARIRSPQADSRRDPYPEEIAILRLISEQNALTMDQLARFFGFYLADMTRFVEEMRSLRWVEVKPLVKGDHPWVWLRQSGAKHAGLGFSSAKPALTTFGHWHAINEARLYLLEHAPSGDWVCERALRRKRGRRGKRRRHIPDALFKVESEVHAIEAELSPKTPEQLEQIVAEHSVNYDAVVYFCSPKTHALIKRLALEDRYPRLFTCELVPNLRQLPEEGFRVEADRRNGRKGESVVRREPEEWEVRIIDLLAEMGGIPLDLLARYLQRDAEATESMVAPLLDAGFIKRAQPEEEGADWIWLSGRGLRFATVKVSATAPTVAGLPNLRAVSEVRLQIMERAKEPVEWVSGRVLRHEHGMKGSLPHAVVEERAKGSEGRPERHAIDVRLTLSADLKKLYERYRQRVADYDWVVWYCAPHARRSALQLQKQFKCPKLVVRTIPGYRPPPGTRRRRKSTSSSLPAVYFEVSPGEVEREVFEVVALAADRDDAIRILSVERRKGKGLKEYRIGTNDGTWCVRCSMHGWKATEILT
jgi:hypothetical protein